MKSIFGAHRVHQAMGGGSSMANRGLTLLLVLTVVVVAVGAVPTSVLASNAKDTSALHGSSVEAQTRQSQPSRSSATSSSTEGKNQISVPQKRGVNPLLYNDLDYSGNSIPHGGVWDDLDGPLSAARSPAPLASLLYNGATDPELSENRMRNFDLLSSLLGPPAGVPSLQQQQTFYGEPLTPSVAYPASSSFYGYGHHGLLGGSDRSKRMTHVAERNPLRSLRLKRSPTKLTTADALSLLALLESRDPYPSMADYYPLVPADGPNDVLPYSPNSVYQDVPLSLALAQRRTMLGGAPLAPYSDDDGEWMNTWTEPAVDYLGFPLDVDTVSRLDNHGMAKPTKNEFSPQKRFLVTMRKRSVSPDENDDAATADCNKTNKKACLLRKYGQLAAAKVTPA